MVVLTEGAYMGLINRVKTAFQFLSVVVVVAVLLSGLNVHGASMTPAESVLATENLQPEFLSASVMADAGGRVLILFAHPKFADKLWAGTAHGGLWRSIDGGISWSLASELMKGLTVSSVALDPGNPDIMYAGTGDGRSNDVAQRGTGMFKSDDGGKNWALLPLTSPSTVGERWGNINYIAINTAGVVLAATSDHKRNGFIFRSVDAGQTWGLFPVYMGSKTGPKNMVHKVRFDPANPNTAIFMDDYANVTHSTDGGVSWNVGRKSSTCK